MSLRKYRDMGSMEGLFTIFNDLKIPWGTSGGAQLIPGLHEISDDKLQAIWDKIHSKYHLLQVQILTKNDNIYEYDPIYIGILPFKIIRLNGSNVHTILVKELNYRFLLLNDFNLSVTDIENNNYDITKISPLYRVIFIDDYFIFTNQHAIVDMTSLTSIYTDFICLLNGNTFDDEIKPYTKLEDHIDPKLAISSLSLKLGQYIPLNFAFNFLKFYANNSFLRKYNPLSIHRDDLLVSQYFFNHDMLRFPASPYNKYDFNLGWVGQIVSKTITNKFVQICKYKKVHISSVLQYIANASFIECKSDIFTKTYYKTITGNTFSTMPLYLEPNKLRYGCHASNYWTVIEYDKNVKMGSDKFWKFIERISAQVLNDDLVRTLYRGKFPFWNMKKMAKWGWENGDNLLIGKVGFGPPTITNPGVLEFHGKNDKYKVLEFLGGANPMVGAGASYLLSAATIKYIGEMNLNLCFGTQFFTQKEAQQMMDKIKQKFIIIANSNVNFTSKL
eukprot:428977_1